MKKEAFSTEDSIDENGTNRTSRGDDTKFRINNRITPHELQRKIKLMRGNSKQSVLIDAMRDLKEICDDKPKVQNLDNDKPSIYGNELATVYSCYLTNL